MKITRALGIAAIAVVALIALPSVAAAEGFESEGYPATLSGVESSTPHIDLWGLGYLECSGFDFAAGQQFSKVSNTATVKPTEAECGITYFIPNGCEFVLHGGPENLAGEIEGSFNIGGPNCKEMLVSWGNPHWKIPAQQNLPATFENDGKHISMELDVENLKYEVEGKTYTDGELGGTWELSGNKGDVSITAGAPYGPVGFFMNGTSSPVFEPEHPAEKISVLESQEHEFTTNLGGVACEDATFARSGELLASTSTLEVTASYSNCLLSGIVEANVNMNSCKYVLYVTASGPYAGSKEIVCPKEGAYSIRISFPGSSCEISISRGLKNAGMGYATTGAGNERKVKATAGLSGVKYQILSCGIYNGTFSNGEETGALTFSAIG